MADRNLEKLTDDAELESLRRSDARYRGLLLASAAIVWFTNAEGEFVELQPAWEAYTGQAWDEYKGSKWISAVHPDDRSQVTRDWTIAVQTGSTVYRTHGRIWSAKHKGWRAFQTRGVPVRDSSGRIVEWVGALADIQDTVDNQHQAAERERDRLRSLLSQVPAIVNFLRGPDLVFEFAHPKAIEAFGGREVIGKPLLEAVPEFRTQDAPALLRRVVETGERLEGREKRVFHDDRKGGLRASYWDFIYIPVCNDQGQVEGVMTFDIEVTEKVQARQTIESQARELAAATEKAERARKEAEAASRTKDEFLAMLGHELRNPLAPILTALQLMRMHGKESREQSIIDRQVKHLMRLVDDLLDVSRITGGKVELKKERLELAEVVFRGLEIAGPLLEQRRQKVDVQVQREGLTIVGDRDRLSQVVSNLLTNAAKYSEMESTIYVRAEADAGIVRLRVRDEGMGIEAAELSRIFDLFVQEPQSPDRSKGGLGLGLSIVRSLVELHGGIVVATSDGPGRGSEFIVELPLGNSSDALTITPHPRPVLAKSPSMFPRPGRDRILVVDDNVDAADSIAEVLRDLGYEVRVAHDAPSALTIARAFPADVCLLDIGLPVMDGYELARALRSSGALAPEARIFAVTGYGQKADRDRSKQEGFRGHLVKPVTLEALLSAIRNA